MSDRYFVEKERQVNGMDYQVVTIRFRSCRSVICFCYHEFEAQLIANALNAQGRKEIGNE